MSPASRNLFWCLARETNKMLENDVDFNYWVPLAPPLAGILITRVHARQLNTPSFITIRAWQLNRPALKWNNALTCLILMPIISKPIPQFLKSVHESRDSGQRFVGDEDCWTGRGRLRNPGILRNTSLL